METAKEKVVEYQLTPKQDKAFHYLTVLDNLSLLYGGAKGGGKSFLLCLWAYQYAKWLIDFWKLPKTKYPIPVGFIGRKQAVDFNKTTMETWKKIIPAESYELKEQDKELIIDGKVKIQFGGLDDKMVVNKFNSAEFAFFAIDQAEETTRQDLSVLKGSLRLVHNGKKPPYKKLYTANPADCWLKEDFIDNPLPHHHYVPALPTDNPHLPEDYMDTLEEAFGYDPVLLSAYKEGKWDVLSSHATLITQSSLNELEGNSVTLPLSFGLVTCDPAIGGDECVLYYMHELAIKDTLILHINDTQKIGAEAIALMNKHKTKNFINDSIGVGKGVGDYVRAGGYRVIELISSKKAQDEEHYSNVRSEMASYVATKVYRRELPYIPDKKCRKQLCSIKYKSGAKKFTLVGKDVTKRLAGESPDRADAYNMGVYGFRLFYETYADEIREDSYQVSQLDSLSQRATDAIQRTNLEHNGAYDNTLGSEW